MATTLASLLVKLMADTADFMTGMDSVGDKITKTGDRMQSIGRDLSLGITAPLAAIGGGAIAASIQFESAFTSVQKTVEATDEEFATLREGIFEMSGVLPESAANIAEVMALAGQLGVKNEDLLTFTRTMIDLGEATNLTAEQSADAMARFMNIMETPGANVSNLASTVVDLGNKSAATESEILEMGLRIAGAGKIVGMTEAEVLGFAAALSSVGIEAQMGGSAISRTMIDMAKEIEIGGDKLDLFAEVAGMSAEEFATAFRDDAAGAIVSFITGLRRIDDTGGDVFGTLDALEIKEIRQTDALLRASGAGDLFALTLGTASKAFEENIALTAEAERRYDTTASKLEIMKNKMMENAIVLGDALVPMMMQLIEVVSPVVGWVAKLSQWFITLPDPVQKAVVGFLAFLAVLGPVLFIVGSIVSTIGSLISVIALVGGAILAVVAAIGIVPLLIAAAIIGIAVLIYMHWDQIKAYLLDAWSWIQDTATTVWDKIGPIIIGTIEWVRDTSIAIWDTIQAATATAWEAILATFEVVKNVVTTVWNAIKVATEFAWGIIADVISTVVNSRISKELQLTLAQWKEWITSAWNFISENVTMIAGHIADFLSAVWDQISSKTMTVWNAISGFLSAHWGTISSTTSSVWGVIRDTFVTVWDFISGKVTDVVTGIFNFIRDHWEQIKDFTATIWDGISNTLEFTWDNIESFIVVILRLLRGDIFGALDEIRDRFSQIWDAIQNAAQAMWGAFANNIVGWIGDAGGVLRNVGEAMLNGLADGVRWVYDHVIKPYFIDLPMNIKNLLFNLGNLLWDVGKALMEGMINGVKSMAGALVDAAKSVVTGAKDAVLGLLKVGSPSKVFMDIGMDTMLGFVEGILAMAPRIDRAMALAISPQVAVPQTPVTPSANTGGTLVIPVNIGGQHLADLVIQGIVVAEQTGRIQTITR